MFQQFIDRLTAYERPQVFNPWQEYDERCDIDTLAPQVRLDQLIRYLRPRLETAHTLLIAEAAGYQGCRFSGIPMTCERMLLDKHKQVRPAMIIEGPAQRTSRPDCPYFKQSTQQTGGLNEPTDTYVWGAVLDNGLNPNEVLLWNIFPFHPHKGTPFTNRTPVPAELADGLTFAKELLALCRRSPSLVAIGRKSADTLTAAGLAPAAVVRHPANGGASAFRQGFAEYLANRHSIKKTGDMHESM